MSDTLFYLLFGGLIAYFWIGGYLRRRRAMQAAQGNIEGLKMGPVPGYSYLPGKSMRWDPDDPPAGLNKTWECISAETVNAGPRRRMVLTLKVKERDRTDQFTVMKTLARRIQERSGFAVIAIQVLDANDKAIESTLVFAPDGTGWTGTSSDATVTAVLPGKAAFRMAG